MALFFFYCLLFFPINADIKASVDSIDSGIVILNVNVENNSSKRISLPELIIYDGMIVSDNWHLNIKKDGKSVYLNNPLFTFRERWPRRLSIPAHRSHSFMISIELSRLIYSFIDPVTDVQGTYQIQVLCDLSPRKGVISSNVVEIVISKPQTICDKVISFTANSNRDSLFCCIENRIDSCRQELLKAWNINLDSLLCTSE